MQIIKHSKVWLGVSSVLVLASIILTLIFGLNLSIDFTGGSILEFATEEITDIATIRESVQQIDIDMILQSAGENQYIARMPDITEEQKQELIAKIQESVGEIDELRFESIGPVLGQELKRKSTVAIVLLLLAIVAYVAWTFRQVSQPVSSWKYGIITILTAIHDVIIPIGVFAVLGQVANYQISIAFVAAILTILGYSINDTIVVFDRTRENVLRKRYVSSEEFTEIVNDSVNQSAMRSINTSVTTLLALMAVFFFGGDALKPFILALMVGILAGAYSSIFVASPLLVLWQKKSK